MAEQEVRLRPPVGIGPASKGFAIITDWPAVKEAGLNGLSIADFDNRKRPSKDGWRDG
jgi:hypothetical protein